MQLLIKQRVFSWSDSYDIMDEAGTVRYRVKGEIFSFGHRLHVYDAVTGEEIGMLRQKVWAWMPTFYIDFGGQTVGTVRRQFAFFRQVYDIDVDDLHIEGDAFGWDYDVIGGGHVLMHITKKLWTWGDTYVLDVVDPSQERLALMLVLAIDAANCTHDDH